jgi:nitrogen regulatory protein PII-like uncharacterized protein
MKSMALRKTLKLWQMRAPLEGDHLTDAMLEGIMRREASQEAFAHLSSCNLCRQRLWKLKELGNSVNQYDDYVLPLAANIGIPHEAVWISADEKYKIEFRRMVSDRAQRAVLIVRVLPPNDFTGRTIMVRDANDRTLLRGQVNKEGKVAAIIEDVENLVLKKLTITEG